VSSVTFSIPLSQGSTFSRRFSLVKKSDGTPVDLSDCDLGPQVLQVYTAKGGSLVTAGTIAVAAPATNGNVDVSFTATQALAISNPLYVWEAKLVEGAVVRRLLGGDFVGLKPSLIP
jgi:hypothetical protein